MTSPPVAFRLTPVLCAVVVAGGLILGGCGDESGATPKSATARQSTAQEDTVPGSEPAAATGCPKQLAAFVASLEALRRRLAVGLAYDDYVDAVKSLRAAYSRIPVHRLTLDCLRTGTPGERALNAHIDAANAWGECLAEAACTTATIAARHLSTAQ